MTRCGTRNRDEWVLSTKVGRLLRPKTDKAPSTDGRLAPMPFTVVYDYGYDGIMRSVEDSYQRLGLARIDILYVHDIGVYQHGTELNARYLTQLRDSGYKALDELRRSGVVSAIGIGVNEKDVLIEALGFGDWDAFLLAGRYTLLEQQPLDDLIPLCQSRGTSSGDRRTAELRHPGGAGDMELRRRAARGRRSGAQARGGLRGLQGAAAGRGVAVPAGASGGGLGDSGTARCQGIPGEFAAVQHENSTRPVVGSAQ